MASNRNNLLDPKSRYPNRFGIEVLGLVKSKREKTVSFHNVALRLQATALNSYLGANPDSHVEENPKMSLDLYSRSLTTGVQEDILSRPDPKERKKAFIRWVKILEQSYNLGDHASAEAILKGLNSIPNIEHTPKNLGKTPYGIFAKIQKMFENHAATAKASFVSLIEKRKINRNDNGEIIEDKHNLNLGTYIPSPNYSSFDNLNIDIEQNSAIEKELKTLRQPSLTNFERTLQITEDQLAIKQQELALLKEKRELQIQCMKLIQSYPKSSKGYAKDSIEKRKEVLEDILNFLSDKKIKGGYEYTLTDVDEVLGEPLRGNNNRMLENLGEPFLKRFKAFVNGNLRLDEDQKHDVSVRRGPQPLVRGIAGGSAAAPRSRAGSANDERKHSSSQSRAGLVNDESEHSFSLSPSPRGSVSSKRPTPPGTPRPVATSSSSSAAAPASASAAQLRSVREPSVARSRAASMEIKSGDAGLSRREQLLRERDEILRQSEVRRQNRLQGKYRNFDFQRLYDALELGYNDPVAFENLYIGNWITEMQRLQANPSLENTDRMQELYKLLVNGQVNMIHHSPFNKMPGKITPEMKRIHDLDLKQETMKDFYDFRLKSRLPLQDSPAQTYTQWESMVIAAKNNIKTRGVNATVNPTGKQYQEPFGIQLIKLLQLAEQGRVEPPFQVPQMQRVLEVKDAMDFTSEDAMDFLSENAMNERFRGPGNTASIATSLPNFSLSMESPLGPSMQASSPLGPGSNESKQLGPEFRREVPVQHITTDLLNGLINELIDELEGFLNTRSGINTLDGAALTPLLVQFRKNLPSYSMENLNYLKMIITGISSSEQQGNPKLSEALTALVGDVQTQIDINNAPPRAPSPRGNL